jgi:Serine carboxypeptidase S28
MFIHSANGIWHRSTHHYLPSSYFGESLPHPINLTTPWKHLKPLTYKQALADLPYFARTFHRESFLDQDLTPGSTPWVMIGCSYSGMRAALSRQTYPETFFAAYASSAPVEARVNFSTFFDQVYRGIEEYGYGNCTVDLHNISSYIDLQLISGNDAASDIKELFLGSGLGARDTSNGDFALALAFTFRAFQSRGMGSGDSKEFGPVSLAALCDYLETDPQIQSPAPGLGLASVRGDKSMTERFASWPPLLKSINRDFKTNCGMLDDSLPASCDLEQSRESDPAIIAWSWLLCSEWGFFTGNNPGPHSIVSMYLNPEYHQKLCYSQFPGAEQTEDLPRAPRAEQFTMETGGQGMRPSNTFWTAGEYDPWRELTPLSTSNLATDPSMAATEAPECNTETKDKNIFGYVIPRSVHCADFTASSAQGKHVRSYFIQALKKWLRCYHTEQ